VRCRHKHQAPEMLESIAALEGVASVEWTGLSH
jgi:hypothetical protein